MAKEKFEKLGKKWLEQTKQVRSACLEFLDDELKKHNGIITWDNSELDCSVTCTYDGGNHPEYKAYPYSVVTGVFISNALGLCVICNDCSDYKVERVCTPELYDICDFIKNYVDDGDKDATRQVYKS